MSMKGNQSLSTLAGQIKDLLYASLFLSAILTTVSLVNLGRLSVFIAPIAFLLTAIHHSTLLYLLHRQRMAETETTKIKLAPTSYKASIIVYWILILLWIVVVLAVVFISVTVVSTYEAWERLAGYFEIPLEAVEVCVLVVLAFKCKKQRRMTLAELSSAV